MERDNPYFTVEDLNNIISKWNYGPLDAENKPVAGWFEASARVPPSCSSPRWTSLAVALSITW
jgi:hypothetical protein